jgi:hypothetical protein
MTQGNIGCIPSFPLGHQAILQRHLSHGEPAFLAEDDILDLTGDEYLIGPSLLQPPELIPIEATTWVEALFEPSDILELRGIPSKQLIAEMAPYQFAWRWTRRQHLFYPWCKASAIGIVVGDLAAMNDPEGVTTGWSHRDRKERKLRFRQVESTPLNIYCSANPRSRPGGSSRRDVRLARCVFVDLEKTSVDVAERARKDARLPRPTMVVNSGHGVHLYWRLLEPLFDLELWTTIQKSLIGVLGSDPSVHDPARVMRIPGFTNVNGVQAPATIAEIDPLRQSELGEILTALPPLDLPSERPGPAESMSIATPAFPSLAKNPAADLPARMSAYLETVEPPVERVRNIRLFAQAARLVEKFDPSVDDLLAAVRAYNARCAEPVDDAEVEHVAGNAYRHVHAKETLRGTLFQVVHEPYREREGELVPLGKIRATLAEGRLESLGQPGTIHFDGSMTGVGKTTADRVAMFEAGKSLTVLPTHDACEELAQALVEAGLTAAAYPPLDASTCQKFGTDSAHGEARMALEAGLNVGEAICPECKFFHTCEYQRRRGMARNAPHAVATHARASSGGFSIAEDKPVVFVHEDPLALLRPMVKVADRPVGPQSSHVEHLRQVVRLAKGAVDVAEQLGDVQKLEFARNLARSTQELVVELEGQALVEDFQVAEKEGNQANLLRVRTIPSKKLSQRPERCDNFLYRAMRHSGIDPDRDSLRLALAHSCGELAHICIVIEDTSTKAKGGEAGGERVFHKALVGVWKVDPPEKAVVWFEDATGDRALLEELLGRSVQDRTPTGKPAYEVPPVQYPSKDVTQATSANIVRGLVRGLLASHPHAGKVGVITHRKHMAGLEGLEPSWADRIARREYFRSGKDRASNSWLECDLILVIGTPRVPAWAVRDWLVRTGRIDVAAIDGRWGVRTWEGKTAKGSLIRVDGLGYADPTWRSMNNLLVRASLLQAIGRGRGITEQGVPVVVVSDENLGLPLAANPVPEIKDPEARTFVAFLELTAINATYNVVGEIAVTASELARRLGDVDERQVRNHLTNLTTLGLLAKKGVRGGWTLARRPK